MVFHWSLSDSKSPQVSRTHLRILAVLSNAVIRIVSTRPPTFKSSRPFSNPLVIVPKAPIIIGTIVTFMFHSFFNCLARLLLLLLLFITSWEFFIPVLTGNLSLESQSQQISSGLQNFSQYSSRSLRWMTSILPLISSPFILFSGPLVFQGHQIQLAPPSPLYSTVFFFQLSGTIQTFVYLFVLFYSTFAVCWNDKIHQMNKLLLLLLQLLRLSTSSEIYSK